MIMAKYESMLRLRKRWRTDLQLCTSKALLCDVLSTHSLMTCKLVCARMVPWGLLDIFAKSNWCSKAEWSWDCGDDNWSSCTDLARVWIYCDPCRRGWRELVKSHQNISRQVFLWKPVRIIFQTEQNIMLLKHGRIWIHDRPAPNIGENKSII